MHVNEAQSGWGLFNGLRKRVAALSQTSPHVFERFLAPVDPGREREGGDCIARYIVLIQDMGETTRCTKGHNTYPFRLINLVKSIEESKTCKSAMSNLAPQWRSTLNVFVLCT